MEGAVEQAAATPDVQHERHARVSEHLPEREQVGMRRRPLAGGRRRHVDRGGPEVEGLAQHRHGAIGIDEGHVRDGKQPLVVLAEVDDRMVVGGATRVEQVFVLADELCGREGGEHQLAVEAEEVEHVAALLRVERADRAPALVLPQPLLGFGSGGGIGGACLRRLRGAVEHRLEHAHRAAAELVDHVGLHEGLEEPGQLHQVAVGVEDRAAVGVGHLSARSRRVS